MHPDLLAALAKARHHDLIGERRGQPQRLRPANRPSRFARPRRRIGLMLIWAGARLMRDRQIAPDIAHQVSG
jgi:hypothetical protein